jgi:hypothetical protein
MSPGCNTDALLRRSTSGAECADRNFAVDRRVQATKSFGNRQEKTVQTTLQKSRYERAFLRFDLDAAACEILRNQCAVPRRGGH